MQLNRQIAHQSWQPLLDQALAKMDAHYLDTLRNSKQWLPGHDRIFNAFTLPLNDINYILFGESPYPRPESAIGYAFWDGAVDSLWSEKGLAKSVNRATSLRNFIKMLLIADGALTAADTTQTAIAAINKAPYIQSIDELFNNMMRHGILLLNISLVLNERIVRKDVKQWHPFMNAILDSVATLRPQTELILFGKLAQTIDNFPSASPLSKLYAEHPYNISFITNPTVIDFFKPMNLLLKT